LDRRSEKPEEDFASPPQLWKHCRGGLFPSCLAFVCTYEVLTSRVVCMVRQAGGQAALIAEVELLRECLTETNARAQREREDMRVRTLCPLGVWCPDGPT
jgi:hypothetical protein